MAIDAIAFIDAMELETIDLLGFSIGSFVAHEICLIRPSLVRRLILASSAPEGAAGMHGWAPQVIGAVGGRLVLTAISGVFFTQSEAGGRRGSEQADRANRRPGHAEDIADPPGAVRRRLRLGIPDHSRLQRVGAIEMPCSWPTATATR